MKTRKIEIKFNIPVPKWWPYASQWKALWKTGLYKVSPDHCHICGRRVNFKGSEFEGTSHGKRVMLMNFAAKPICNHCTADKIGKYYDQSTLDVAKCDCCGEYARVAGGIPDFTSKFNLDEHVYEANRALAKRLGLDVRYGMAWWNGFSICRNCVDEALRTGYARSSVISHWRGKAYWVNHRGALISRKGNSL